MECPCTVHAVWLCWLFLWAHLKQIQRMCRVWLCGFQINRKGPRFAADGCACCIEGFTCAHNDPWTVPITVSSHDIYDIASLHKDNLFQRRCRQGAAQCFCGYFTLCLISSGDFTLICSSSIFHPGQWQSRKTERWNIGGVHCRRLKLLGGEGAEVNYSITRRLSQELFKQAPASRGLGLITPAKVTPTTLSNRLLQCVCQAFGGIFIRMEEGSI